MNNTDRTYNHILYKAGSQDSRKDTSSDQMTDERSRARRRAAAARRRRISSGEHAASMERLRKKQELSGSRRSHQNSTDAIFRGNGKRDKRRFFSMFRIGLAALCIAAVLAFNPITDLIHMDSVEASSIETDTSYRIIEIQKGDSLWSIAEAYYSPEFHSIPEMIEEIKECNGLTSDRIDAGCYLMVPRP